MDFTLSRYKSLLETLLNNDYQTLTVERYASLSEAELPLKFVLLRHDVDRLPEHSLLFAKIQAELGMAGTYYFRAIEKTSWVPEIVRKIHQLGHEIGYHYENFAIFSGDKDRSIADFNTNLSMMRSVAPVRTICMHGSPLSKYDNRDLWKFFNYREFQIICEPYFDIDFTKVFYLTDTGRRWNGDKFSIRDKVQQKTACRTTAQIIHAIETDTFPRHVMMTFHPQRWNDPGMLWFKELLWQNTKNLIKYFLKK